MARVRRGAKRAGIKKKFYSHFDSKSGLPALGPRIGDPALWHRMQIKRSPNLRAWGNLISDSPPSVEGLDHRAALRSGLSAREAEVFVALAQGKSNKEIAAALAVSYDTARAHVRSIFAKLRVSSRVAAVHAVRGGTA